MHEDITTVLRQEQTGNNNGMDMSITVIEESTENDKKVTFSGAKHSLYYTQIENSTPELKEVKGTRKAIGGYQDSQIKFTNTELLLPSKTWIYLRSDGFEDQNNTVRKRFGRRALNNLLSSNTHLPAEDQKNELLNALDAHSKGVEQRDDILLIGFQL